MDFLDFDKLNEQVSICESIAVSVTDDSRYNAVTKQINTGYIMEAHEDAHEIIRNGHDIANKIDFTALSNAVNNALGINESVELDTTEEDQQMTKNTTPKVEAIDTADKFLNAKPIEQTKFVVEKTASKESKELEKVNTNADQKVTEHKSETAVEKQADSVMKKTQKEADANKEWEENSKKQATAETKSILKENAATYVAFVESLRDTDNSKVIDCVLKAFNVVINAPK